MLNQVLKVSQEHVNSLLYMMPRSVTFLDFWISQGRVATLGKWDGNLHIIYIEIFLRINWWQNENRATLAKRMIKDQGDCFFIGAPCSYHQHTGGDNNSHCNDNRTNYRTANNDDGYDDNCWGSDNSWTDDDIDNISARCEYVNATVAHTLCLQK